MAEGTWACASGLGNIATLDHFDALAFVKYRAPKVGGRPTTNPKPETFAKMGFPATRMLPKPETFTKNQQQMQQQISTNGECLSSFQCFCFIQGY